MCKGPETSSVLRNVGRQVSPALSDFRKTVSVWRRELIVEIEVNCSIIDERHLFVVVFFGEYNCFTMLC